MANVTRTNAPGASRTRSRSAATGSSTAPVVPDSARPSSASGIGRRPPAAEEPRAIGLPFDGAAEASVDAEHVERPGRRLVGAARAPAEQQAGALRVELGLDEQLAERRVGEVVLGTRQHDLGVAGDLDLARPIAAIGDRQAPHLDVVFRRHGDLQLRLEVAVAPAERDLVELEGRLVLVGLAADRLVGRRPDVARPRIAQVDEVRARIRGPVLALARDRQAAPGAGAAAGVRERGGVAAVRQEVRVRAGGVRRSEAPATRTPAATAAPVALSAGRGSDRIASRGTRSCSSSSVACTRGSAWNRVTKTSSQTTLASATSDMP